MHIIEINDFNEDKGIKLFLDVALQVYKDDPVWVPQSEQAFLERFKSWKSGMKVTMWPLVALVDNHPVARGAAILASGATDEGGNPQGWIGFFESLKEHQDIAAVLLQRCEDKLQAAGAKSILAPKADNLLVGLLTQGFTQPQTVLSNHNPPYYLDMFQKRGYEIWEKLHTFNFTEETAKQAEIKIPGFTTRKFDRNRLSQELVIFHMLQNFVFTGTHQYIPRTLEEDGEMVQSFLPFLDDDLVIIAEDSEGSAVGLLICLPDLYQVFKGDKINRARIVSIGVMPGWKTMGVGSMMGSHLMRNLLKKGYRTAEASWILGNNIPPHNLAKRFNASAGKEYVLLGKKP
jgi:GNAT superfamily N-acetyltransferase